MRVGIGFDMHPFTSGRRLVLGGITVPFELGLEGWSDGDVLTHAVIDALLGAAAMGDIGTHFPSGDEQYRDIHSLILLTRVGALLDEYSWQVVNLDATVIADEPKLGYYIDGMRQNLAFSVNIPMARVSVKPHTTNGMGISAGRQGIAAYAVCLIDDKPKIDISLDAWI